MASTDVSQTGAEEAKTLEPHEVTAYLTTCSTADRLRFFKHQFNKTSEPIQDMAEPELVTAHPEYREEILDGYLKYTTFTAKVWVNYDAARKQFYNDDRARTCGTLVHSREDCAYMQSLASQHIEVHRVRFDIGTPFTTLGQVILRPLHRTAQGRTLASLQFRSMTNEHEDWTDFVQSVTSRLNGAELEDCRDGFDIESLKTISRKFVRQPTEEESWHKFHNVNGPSVWMDFHDLREDNPAFVERDVLEQTRNGVNETESGGENNGWPSLPPMRSGSPPLMFETEL